MIDPLEKALYADEAQLLDWGESRTAGKWVKLRLSETEGDPLAALRGLDPKDLKHSNHVLLMTLSLFESVDEEQPPKPQKGPYGEYARQLHTSGFFRAPAVWRALGTDDDFQVWCRLQKCVVCGDKDYPEEFPEGICEYAHVRRVARGSGTAIKPPFSGVPMCHNDHALQHNNGEVAAFVRAATFKPQLAETGQYNTAAAQAWFDEQNIKHLERWAHETLVKKVAGKEVSLSAIEPNMIYEFCRKRSVEDLLPKKFKEAG